ncbi:hypothetical protein AB1N83_001022 [Pleurotus pulmonarius]
METMSSRQQPAWNRSATPIVTPSAAIFRSHQVKKFISIYITFADPRILVPFIVLRKAPLLFSSKKDRHR